MKSAVTSVLNRVLGEFVENLDTDNLNMSLLSGTVTLNDLRIKRSAIEKFGFPFTIQSGFLKRVFVKIPWTSLTSSPLQVEVSGLHLHLETTSKEHWDTALVQEMLNQNKQVSLSRFELMHSPEVEVSTSPGFAERLVSKIVNNLQLEVTGVFIRLEDRVSSIHPFAVGVTLKRLAAVTCNSAWKPEYIEEASVQYKQILLEGLSIYLDYADPAKVNSNEFAGGFKKFAEKEAALTPPFKHSYLIEPVFLTLKLTINMNAEGWDPLFQALLSQRALKVRAEDLHVTHLLKFLEFYGLFTTFCQGVEAQLPVVEFTEAAAHDYTGLYLAFKQNGKPEALVAFEREFKYEDLVRQRLIILEERRLEEAEDLKLQEIAQLEESAQAGYFSGVKNWFGYGKSAAEQQTEDEERHAKIDAARAELVRIRKKQSLFASDMDQFLGEERPSLSEFADDYVKMQANIDLEQFQLSICQGAETKLTFLANGFSMKAGVRPSSVFAEFSLQETQVQDFTSQGSVFPMLLHGGLLEGRYDQYPHTIVGLRSEAMQVLVNLKALLTIGRIFREAVASKVNLDEYAKAAASYADYYIRAGREYVQGMFQGNYQYNSIDLRLALKAPVFIFPLDLTQSSDFIVLDLGRLEASTKRVMKVIAMVDYRLIEADDQLYDTYNFSLSDVALSSVEACSAVESWKDGQWTPLYSQQELSLKVATCIIQDHPVKPVLRVESVQRDLKLRLSDRQLLLLLKLKASGMETFAEYMPAGPTQTLHLGIKDQMKNIGPVISQVFSLRVESLVVETDLQDVPLFRLSSQQFSTVVHLARSGSLALKMKLVKVFIEDLRPNSISRKVLYCPSDDSAVEEFPQLLVDLEVKSQDDSTRLSVTLNDLCLSAVPDFLSSLMSFYSDPFAELASTSPSSCSSSELIRIIEGEISQPQIKPVPASEVSAERSLTCHFKLSNFQLLFPNARRVLSLHFGMNASYSSTQHYRYLLDAQGYVQDIEYSYAEDEASLEMFHLGLQVLAHDAQPLSEMLVPCRISASYSSLQKPDAVACSVELVIESISVLFGFRDLKQLQDISTKWLQILPQQSEAVSTAVVAEASLPTIYSVKLQCDSIQFQLTDDTVDQPYSLIYAQIPNLTAGFDYGDSLVGALSISFNADYYNVPKSVWEPLLEEWTLELRAVESEDIALLLSSGQTLNLNLSFQMLQVLTTLGERLAQNEADWGSALGRTSNMNSQASIYSIINRLGVDAYVWVDVPTNMDRWLLKPDEARQMSRAYIEDIINAHSNTRKTSLYSLAQPAACIAVNVTSEGTARGLSLDDVGTKSFLLKEGDRTCEFLLAISTKGREIQVSLENSLQVMNNLDFSVTLFHGELSLNVESSSAVSLPIKWAREETFFAAEEGHVLIDANKTCVLAGHNVSVDALHIKVKAEKKRKAHLVVVQLNPAFTLQNLLPCLVSVHQEDSEEPLAIIEPGSESPLYTLVPGSQKPVQFKLHLGRDRELMTDWLPIEKSDHPQLKGNFAAHKLSVEVEPLSLLRNHALDLRFVKAEKSLVKAKTVRLFAQFLIVNKTHFALECGKRTKMALGPNSFSFFKSNRSQLKIRRAGAENVKPSKWSDGFNIEAAGIAGSVNLLNRKANASGDGPTSLLLGVVMYNAPPPLLKTKIVYIVPRFILHNTFQFPLYMRQMGINSPVVVEAGAKLPIVLDDPSQPRLIQVSTDREYWSTAINVENIEDFQVKVRSNAAEDREPRWYEPSEKNYFMQFIRVVIISEDDATIFINLLCPRDPEFQILNLSHHDLTFRQLGQPEYTVLAGEAMPFAFDDPDNRKIVVRVEGHERAYSFDKVKKLKSLHDCKVSCVVMGVTRVLQIMPKEKSAEENFDRRALFRYASQSKSIQKSIDLEVNLFAIGFSIIDDTPRERFFMSLSDIEVHVRQERKTSNKEVEVSRKLEVKVGHVQLDNMLCKENQFRVILCPTQAFASSEIPFFQLGVHLDSVYPSEQIKAKNVLVESASMDRVTLLSVSMQEMQVKLDQTSLFEVVDLLTRVDESMHSTVSEIRRSRKSTVILPEDTFLFVQADQPSLSFDATQMSRKAYIQNMTVFGVKVVLSLRLSQRKVQLSPSQGFGLLVLITNFGSALANVSESPLYFKAIVFEHLFQTMSNLSWLMLKNYSRQGILQFYKVIGSSDLLGNPIGLIDKLGSGVLEFFSEPYKGMLKGPGEFVEGVSKGVRALVGNVISGSFGSVSKITGSLYTIVHEATGHEPSQLKEGDNVFTGVYLGVTGGVTELASGLAGFFTKPIQGAKRSGVLGFFKGAGAGVLGVVTAPLAAALRLGSSVATGISNTGTLLSKGKIQHYGRMRFPRQFGVRRVLEPYDEELAQAQELINTLKDFKRQQIACYVQVEADVMVILTLKHLFLLTTGDLKKSMKLTAVVNCEVHRINEVFYFCAATRRNQIVVRSAFYGPLARLYLVLSSMPTGLASTVFSAKYHFDQSYGRGCCG
jgi:hypothetical protein